MLNHPAGYEMPPFIKGTAENAALEMVPLKVDNTSVG